MRIITEFLDVPVRVNRTFVAVFYYSCWAIIVACFDHECADRVGKGQRATGTVPSDGRVEDDAPSPAAVMARPITASVTKFRADVNLLIKRGPRPQKGSEIRIRSGRRSFCRSS